MDNCIESKIMKSAGFIWENAEVIKCKYIDMETKCAVIPKIDKSKYTLLEGIGQEIWKAMDKKEKFDSFISRILNKYVVDKDVLAEDLYYFLIALKDQKLISLKDDFLKDEVAISKEGYRYSTTDGKSYYNYDVVYSYFMEKQRPFKVFFELTYKCNLKCRHCYLGEPPKTNELSIEKIKQIIDQMKEYGVVELTFTGGEASSFNGYLDVIEYACNQGFVVTLLTNGTCLQEDDIIKLKNMGLNEVRISIYGFEDYHDYFVKVKGSFNKSIKSLEMLGTLGTAAIVLTEDTIEEIPSLLNFLNSKGIEASYTPLISPTIYGDIEPINNRLKGQNIKKYVEELNIRVGGSICTAGISRFRITPNGDVDACEMLRHVKFGNLLDNSFSEVMESAARKEWINRYKQLVSNRCNDCQKKKYCINCIGLAYLETGDMTGITQYACDLAEAQFDVWEHRIENGGVK